MTEGFDECRKRLLEMGYDEAHVDEVLARMRQEEEMQSAAGEVRVDLPHNQVAGPQEET